MPQVEVNLGQMAQMSGGASYCSIGSFGRCENPRSAEFGMAGQVPRKPPKPPLCKTCHDRECVGNCRY
jgi:hypothetical protein